MRVAFHQNQKLSGYQRALTVSLLSPLTLAQLQKPLEPTLWAASHSSRPSRLPMTASRRAAVMPNAIGRQSTRLENPLAGVPGPAVAARSSRGAARL